jgi:hypothetical protein
MEPRLASNSCLHLLSAGIIGMHIRFRVIFLEKRTGIR